MYVLFFCKVRVCIVFSYYFEGDGDFFYLLVKKFCDEDFIFQKVDELGQKCCWLKFVFSFWFKFVLVVIFVQFLEEQKCVLVSGEFFLEFQEWVFYLFGYFSWYSNFLLYFSRLFVGIVFWSLIFSIIVSFILWNFIYIVCSYRVGFCSFLFVV